MKPNNTRVQPEKPSERLTGSCIVRLPPAICVSRKRICPGTFNAILYSFNLCAQEFCRDHIRVGALQSESTWVDVAVVFVRWGAFWPKCRDQSCVLASLPQCVGEWLSEMSTKSPAAVRFRVFIFLKSSLLFAVSSLQTYFIFNTVFNRKSKFPALLTKAVK